MRRSSVEVIGEFQRLYVIFETMSDCMFNQDGQYWTTGMGQHVATRARMLSWIDSGKATPSQLVSGTREALNDLSEGLLDGLRHRPDHTRSILARYRQRRGTDFWADAGHPKKLVKYILKQGALADETEYRLVKAWLDDAPNDVLSEDQITTATELIVRFEAAARGAFP